MSSPVPEAIPAEYANVVLERIAALTDAAPVILVDGASGLGKSTLAAALLRRWPLARPARLIALDDVYPGWDGLDAGSEAIVSGLLQPRALGRVGSWRAWDWDHRRLGAVHPVSPMTPLIIEGCGALSRSSASLAHLRVWLRGDDDVRKRRALTRDAGAFDAHWDMWDAQFERFVLREHPQSLADVVVDVR